MSLASGDLTTLATVRQYMDSPPADAILSGLITRISRSILTSLNRQILVPFNYSQQFNGTGTANLVLPYWPLLSLDFLSVGGRVFDRAPLPGNTNVSFGNVGWRFVPWNNLPPGTPANVELVGYRFYKGLQNVVAEYRAGYRISGESAVVPSTTGPYTITPLAPYGIWATDEGVTFSDGTPLEAVTTITGPAQYIPPNPANSINNYTFSLFEADQTVLLSYGYIPADVEQVAIELISERALYRKRVGVRSQMLAAQETIVYDNSGITGYVRQMLSEYVCPIPTMTGATV